MRKAKYYITMTAAECRIAVDALLSFRNKALAKGIDTVDIDQIIRKLQKRRWF